jgi:thiosulfate dehydrogenase [quinone] large subunit
MAKATTAAVADTDSAASGSNLGFRFLSLTRIAIGFIFLWAFLDKLIGLGFSTCRNPETNSVEVLCEKAWLSGGAITKGYLGSSSGPLADFFITLGGQRWTDWFFMLGLLGIGLALMLGIGTKIAAWSGVAMLLMMYVSHAWPGAGGNTTNPFLDDHIIYGLAAVGIVYVELQRQSIGLGKWWRSLAVVQKNPWLI